MKMKGAKDKRVKAKKVLSNDGRLKGMKFSFTSTSKVERGVGGKKLKKRT